MVDSPDWQPPFAGDRLAFPLLGLVMGMWSSLKLEDGVRRKGRQGRRTHTTLKIHTNVSFV